MVTHPGIQHECECNRWQHKHCQKKHLVTHKLGGAGRGNLITEWFAEQKEKLK